MGCAPTVSTMTSSESMPTAKRSTGVLATKRSRTRGRVRFLALPTLVLRYGADGTDALRENAGTHRLHIRDIAERSE